MFVFRFVNAILGEHVRGKFLYTCQPKTNNGKTYQGCMSYTSLEMLSGVSTNVIFLFWKNLVKFLLEKLLRISSTERGLLQLIHRLLEVLTKENRIYFRVEFTRKKCKTAILLYCFHTAGVLYIFMLYNLLGPGISFYRKYKINVKRKPNN